MRKRKFRHNKPAILDSGWTATFEAGRGVDAPIVFNSLSSWSASDNQGVKYFSGIADYHRAFPVSAAWLHSGDRIFLSLGDVHDVAKVAVNGRNVGTLWKAPYRVDVTAALHKGTNQISVQVTNLWVNRLIGDQQLGAVKYTFTTFKPYSADSPLLPSGLLGPVKLVESKAR